MEYKEKIQKAQCRLISAISNSSELYVPNQLKIINAANDLYDVAKEQIQIERPPIGIIPKYLWDEQRRDELSKAIDRYIKFGRKVPEEWWVEYNSACTK